MAKNVLGFDYGGSRETPAEAAISSAMGMQNIFARQMQLNEMRQEQEAMNALRGEMGGMDMNNPDYAKIFSLAPKFGLEFMNGMAQLNQEQRLTALNLFKTGQDIVAKTRTLYAMNPTPELREQAISALTGVAKYDRKYAEALYPDPNQFKDMKSFQMGILAGEDINEYMKSITQSIKNQGLARTAQSREYVANQKLIGERDTSASKERVAQIMAGATLGSAQIRLDTVALQQGHPQEVDLGTDENGEKISGRAIYDPKKKTINIVPYPKGVTRYEKPTGKGGGTATSQVKMDQADVDKYNKIVASGQSNYIAEAQKYMRSKYGRLPGEEIKGGSKTGKASLWD